MKNITKVLLCLAIISMFAMGLVGMASAIYPPPSGWQADPAQTAYDNADEAARFNRIVIM